MTYMLLLVILVGLIIWSISHLRKNQRKWTGEYEKIKDMYKCPQTVAYFSNLQTNFLTWPFGVVAGCVMGTLTLFIFIGMNVMGGNRVTPVNIFILTILFTVMGVMMVYKIENFVISRMCGQKSCSSGVLN